MTNMYDSQYELDSKIDPATIPIRPEETLISARLIESHEPQRPISAIEALQMLAGVQQTEDIGKERPVVASAAFPEHHDIRELRSYEVVFGRDSLITAAFLFEEFPQLTKATVRKLAEMQGVTFDPMSEEEEGKIVHEGRPPEDPISKELIEKWGWKVPYYGSVDATPLFISAVYRYTKEHEPSFLDETYTDKTGRIHTIRESTAAALSWLVKKMDSNPDQLVESQRLNTVGGLVTQSWKDSFDSHHHADGSLANHAAGISSLEVQGYAYDALLDAAEIFPERAAELKQKAQQLKNAVLEKLWVNQNGQEFFALGSDRDSEGNLRPLAVKTSNMGQLLNSRLLDDVDPKYVEQTVKTLFSPTMLAKSGIRTLAADENRYRPYSYHNGSVWPWDTGWVALGLERRGYHEEARELQRRVQNVMQTTKRFPELVCGDDDKSLLSQRLIKVYDNRNQFENAIEQPPQEIQAWSVASALVAEKALQNS